MEATPRPHRDRVPITFALLQPAQPGNVGAAARSLAAFGFDDLCLLAPLGRPGHHDAALAARGGRPLLHQARRIAQAAIPEFLEGFDEIWGTTARRGRQRPLRDPRSAVGEYLTRRPGRLLVLFGPERDGLSRAWLDRCHGLVRIPTTDRPLNLAHAVSVIAYEFCQQQATEPPPEAGATAEQRREILRRSGALLAALAYPTRALRRHPPQRILEPIRTGPLSPRQARWLLGLLDRLERRLAPAQRGKSGQREKSKR